MTVAFDASSSTSGTAASFTFAHTCTGTNRFLLVHVSLRRTLGVSVSSVTYAGIDLGAALGFTSNSDDTRRVHIYGLAAPASGANNIVVTLSASEAAICGGISFTEAHQTTPTGTYASATGASGNASVTVTSGVDEFVADVLSDVSGTWTVGAGQTQRWNTAVGTTTGAGSTEPGAASVVMSWTAGVSDRWVIGGVSVKAAGWGGLLSDQRNQLVQA